MPYTKVSEATSSLWITKGSTRVQFPLEGQGGAVTGIGSSILSGAGPARPVIVEGVMVEYVTGAARDIRIVDTSANVLHTINVAPTVGKVAQYFQVGGPYGMRFDQPVGFRVDATGNVVIPITGVNELGLVHIFFRYA